MTAKKLTCLLFILTVAYNCNRHWVRTEMADEITIHMVSSLDGIIAGKDNSVSCFEASGNYEQGVVGENPEEFLKSISSTT